MTSTTASASSIAVRAVDLPRLECVRRARGSCSSVSALRRGGRGGRGPGPRGTRGARGTMSVASSSEIRAWASASSSRMSSSAPCASASSPSRRSRSAAAACAASSACARSVDAPSRSAATSPRTVPTMLPSRRRASLSSPRSAFTVRARRTSRPVSPTPSGDRQLQQRAAPRRERVGGRDVRGELERRGERGAQHTVVGPVGLDDRAQLEALDGVLQQQLDAAAERPWIGRAALELDDGDVVARGRDLEADDLEGGIHAQVPRGGSSVPRSSVMSPSTSSVSVRSRSS